MEKTYFYIEKTPAILWNDGFSGDKVYLFLHGQGGNKEEAKVFSEIVSAKGWQTVSIDLPEHGERTQEKDTFFPWNIVPELTAVLDFMKTRWSKIALCANSIGAWLSLLTFGHETFHRCLFISPVLDMERLTRNMMALANVTEFRLKKERKIPTNLGQTLSWEYFQYVTDHPVREWYSNIQILYGENDHLTEPEVLEQFSSQFPCDISVIKDMEHWFHTPEQLEIMYHWMKEFS